MMTENKPARFNVAAAMANDPANPAVPLAIRNFGRFDMAAAMAKREGTASESQNAQPRAYSLVEAMRRHVEAVIE